MGLYSLSQLTLFTYTFNSKFSLSVYVQQLSSSFPAIRHCDALQTVGADQRRRTENTRIAHASSVITVKEGPSNRVCETAEF